MRFTPGPGIGGHCIPVDPRYLSWKLQHQRYHARFIDLATEINGGMPRYWVEKVQDALNDVAKPLRGSNVLVLGVSFKRDVADTRESPALDIIALLQEKGAVVRYHDPFVSAFHTDTLEMMCVADVDRALEEADCVVIATDHTVYETTGVRDRAALLVDTRGARRREQPTGVLR
jgi:UDP-N-acetyl-D-glucosamine dehydrogenase